MMEAIHETLADHGDEEGGGGECGMDTVNMETRLAAPLQEQQELQDLMLEEQDDDKDVEEKTLPWPPPPPLSVGPLASVMNQVSLLIQGLTGANGATAATTAASTSPLSLIPVVAFHKRRSSTQTFPDDSSTSNHDLRSSSFQEDSSPTCCDGNNECNGEQEVALGGMHDIVGRKHKIISRLRLQRCLLVALALFLLFLVLLLGGLLGRSNKRYSSYYALSQQKAQFEEKGNGGGTTTTTTEGSGSNLIDASQQPNQASTDKASTSSTNSSSSSSSSTIGTSSSSPGSYRLPSGSGGADVYAGHHCGCPACSQEIWDSSADSHTCGQRITFLHETFPLQYLTQQDACRVIAFEYPCVCGGCDPARCNWIPETPFTVPVLQHDIDWKPADHVISALDTEIQDSAPVANLDTLHLYCFPDASSTGGGRIEYTMWGGMKVQVKQDPASNPCGPGNNIFSNQTVVVDPVLDELTLKFANGLASEVRVLLPEAQRPYTYGNYAFSVKSILVKDVNHQVISTVLPKELVLGIFTWDDTEDYATHQNYNHEVDVEVSRWNCEDNSDVQFLVQPPGAPQQYRFFSGQSDALDVAQQLDHSRQHWYNFSWTPGRIDWSSTAGGGIHDFSLTTEEALYKGVPDYVQCMPGSTNVEVRLNLWNMLGSRQPAGLAATDHVEVVFDKFVFEPSSKTYLEDGEFCSKSCQCNVASSSQCVDAVCARVGY